MKMFFVCMCVIEMRRGIQVRPHAGGIGEKKVVEGIFFIELLEEYEP